MPIYVLRCPRCKTEREIYLKRILNFTRCPRCSKKEDLIMAPPTNRQNPSYPYMDDYIDQHPLEIKSLNHYRRELKVRGLEEKPRGKGNKGQWI